MDENTNTLNFKPAPMIGKLYNKVIFIILFIRQTLSAITYSIEIIAGQSIVKFINELLFSYICIFTNK